MKFRRNTVSTEVKSEKPSNKYRAWVNNRTQHVVNRFNQYSPRAKSVIFVLVFAIIGTIVLQLASAEGEYGSIMTGSDQLVMRYEVPMAHPLVQNDFALGTPPLALLYGDGLMLCNEHAMNHSDSQTSPLMFTKQRLLNPDEINALFEKIRSLGFDDLLVRTLPDAPVAPTGSTSSVSLVTSTGERRVTMYPEEVSESFNAITQYIISECAKANEDFYPDDVILESIKTTEVADSKAPNLPDIPGELSSGNNEVQSTRLTGQDAKKAKNAVSKGNKEYKASDGKKIKVRVLPKIPDFQSPKPYIGKTSGAGIARAENYRKVRFLYVVGADQAIPGDAQAVLNDLASTLPGYYHSQLGKTFTTLSAGVVKGSKTAAQYQSCPSGRSCSGNGGIMPQALATYYNLQDEYLMHGVSTIVMHSWSNDNICVGIGGPALTTDNVNISGYDYGFASFSTTNCWKEARYKLGAHEGGHTFGLVHTCDTTMMDGCGYSKAPGYGSPLHVNQANLLRDASPYFNGPVPEPQSSPVLSGTTYLSVNPARLLDSRANMTTIDGQYVGVGRRAAKSVTEVQIAGRGGIPSDSLSVTLNVTAINSESDGFLTVYPCGISPPNSSNVNYTTGSITANFVISKLSSGKVCIYTLAATDLLVDVSGAFPAGSGNSFTSLSPARLMDSRAGGPTVDGQFSGTGQIAAGTAVQLQVTSRAGIPSNASAVSLNVTAVNSQANGFVTVYPCDGYAPATSSVNYFAGKVVSNAVISKVGYGKICLYSSATSDFVVDVNGAFNSITAYSSILPTRLLDSRAGMTTVDGQYLGIGRRPANSVTEVQIAGRGSIKGDALVASLNVVAVSPSGPGFLTIFPCGIGVPNTSNINYVAGSVVANFAISKLGSGKVCIYTKVDTDLVVDVNGAFVAADVQQYGLSQVPPPAQNPTVSNDTIAPLPCPSGYSGTYPNCVPPPCPSGYTGTYPNCVLKPTCPSGYSGTYPNCVPPPICSGVKIFKDANYLGISQTLTVGKYEMSNISLGNDAISSAQIPSGCKLTLYLNSELTGATQVLTSNWPGSISDPWNDKASSIEISEYVISSNAPKICMSSSVTIYRNASFGGTSQILSIGSFNTSQIKLGDNRISSVKVASGCKVTLYQNSGFSGATKVLTGDWSAASGDPWNDITSSIEVKSLQ